MYRPHSLGIIFKGLGLREIGTAKAEYKQNNAKKYRYAF